MKLSILLGLITYAAYGLWDVTNAFGAVETMRFRYMIACPLMGIILALSFTDVARRHWHALTVSFVTTSTVCIYVAGILLERETPFKVATGTPTINYNLAIAFLALFPVRATYNVVLTLVIQLAHGLLITHSGTLSTTMALAYCSSLTCISAIVILVGYGRERLLRRDFLHQQTVLDEKDLLKNQLLSFVSLDALDRAKLSGKAVADAFGEVTVIFCDIEGFTGLAERLAPKHLVEVLNDVFSALDQVAGECKVEKVKTIGDAYMAISGTSDESRNSAEDAAEFALRAHEQTAELANAMGHPLSFRIGMHTGSLIGGVVGRQKMAYDYWGKTVNIASRLESTGVAGKVHVSETTYWRLSTNYVLEARDKIDLKGIGPMETYFLVSRKQQIAVAQV